MMHARASTIQAARDKTGELERIIQADVLSQLEQIEGYSGIVGMVDQSTGKCLVISFWETDAALRASEEKANRLRGDAAKRLGATGTAEVERFEVVFQEVRTPVHA